MYGFRGKDPRYAEQDENWKQNNPEAFDILHPNFYGRPEGNIPKLTSNITSNILY